MIIQISLIDAVKEKFGQGADVYRMIQFLRNIPGGEKGKDMWIENVNQFKVSNHSVPVIFLNITSDCHFSFKVHL